jgi:hypothetical protein
VKCIMRLSISAPVSHALSLRPIAQAVLEAIHEACKSREIAVVVDLDLNASNPKAFARRWDAALSDDEREQHVEVGR